MMFLALIVRLLDSFDLWNGLLLGLALHFVGGLCGESRLDLLLTARRIAVGVFLVLLLGSLLHDWSLYYLMNRMLQAGGLAWITAGAAKILLPVLAALRGGQPRSRAQRHGAKRSAQQKRLELRRARVQEEQRLKRETEWEAGREAREAAAAEAEKAALEKAERRQEEQQRREDARFEVQLLFDRHYGDIGTSLPRKRFDKYLVDELGDNRPAEVVEQRAEQMKQTILDFFEADSSAKQSSFLDEQLAELEDQRRQLDGKEVADELLEEITAQLNHEEDRLNWEKLQNE